MIQQQTDNKAAQLLIAAVLTNTFAPSAGNMPHDQAEAMFVTQFERWYNFCARAMLPNDAMVPVKQADGTMGQELAHPPGVFNDPPASDPSQMLNGAVAGLLQNPAGIQGLLKTLAPLLSLIPGPAGQLVATTAQTLSSLPPISMPAGK